MPLLFDRQRDSHVWLRALSELEAEDSTVAMVAANWRMDHRVSEAREVEVLGSVELGHDLDGWAWWEARSQHFVHTLCCPASPKAGGMPSAYLGASNGNNALDRRALPPHEQLIHLVSLNRLLQRLSRDGLSDRVRLALEDLLGGTFAARPGSFGHDPALLAAKVDEIASAVNGRGEAEVRQLAILLGEALGPREPPWWSAFAQEVMPEVHRNDWGGLAAVLGLGHLGAGQWLFVWRFELAVLFETAPATSLTRPTVIEANDSPYHFPSPPSLPWGITMPLRERHDGAVRELLHPPLRVTDASRCSCLLVRLEEDPASDVSANGIAALRTRHRRRLESEFPAGDTHLWLERHRGSV